MDPIHKYSGGRQRHLFWRLEGVDCCIGLTLTSCAQHLCRMITSAVSSHCAVSWRPGLSIPDGRTRVGSPCLQPPSLVTACCSPFHRLCFHYGVDFVRARLPPTPTTLAMPRGHACTHDLRCPVPIHTVDGRKPRATGPDEQETALGKFSAPALQIS